MRKTKIWTMALHQCSSSVKYYLGRSINRCFQRETCIYGHHMSLICLARWVRLNLYWRSSKKPSFAKKLWICFATGTSMKNDVDPCFVKSCWHRSFGHTLCSCPSFRSSKQCEQYLWRMIGFFRWWKYFIKLWSDSNPGWTSAQCTLINVKRSAFASPDKWYRVQKVIIRSILTPTAIVAPEYINWSWSACCCS